MYSYSQKFSLNIKLTLVLILSNDVGLTTLKHMIKIVCTRNTNYLLLRIVFNYNY